MNDLNLAGTKTIDETSINLIQKFQEIPIDESWTFEHLKRKETSYITHDYHRYPAKFIPQVASKLIKKFTKKGDLIGDPFMGSGTTLVEALVNERYGIGVDINPAAYIISKAKTTPINPKKLNNAINMLYKNIEKRNIDSKTNLDSFFETPEVPYENGDGNENIDVPSLERIDYWFDHDTKLDLAKIWHEINSVENEEIKIFLMCGFSHILKNCSRWLMKSTKPTIDKNKGDIDSYKSFKRHVNKMKRKNEEFYNFLSDFSIKNHEELINAELGDCRNLPCDDNVVDLIVTSPPYVTSYEYADLHQLTVLWFGYETDIKNLRPKFVGTAMSRKNIPNKINSSIAETTVNDLRSINQNRLADSVHAYFFEMQECLIEMQRILKPGGKSAIVIGNTSLKKVPIYNGEVFAEIGINIGFNIYDVIKRRIPGGGKILPSTRDPVTGKFTSLKSSDKVEAYSTEYILILEKSKS